MRPDELIPRPKNELSLGKASSNEITSRMAEDLLAIRKDELLDDAVVHFKCENLEKALREQLEIPDRPITRRDLAGVTELEELDEREITDLSGLEGMTQLKKLSLGYNQISDISPLQGMTQLTNLWLWENQISESQIEKLREALPDCNIKF